MARDPELSAHLEWLGYIQPVGLVVSPPALVQAQAHINRNVIPQHQRFIGCLPVDKDDEPLPLIDDLPKLVREVLDWQDTDLIHFDDAVRAGRDVNGLEVVLPEYNETLRPTWIVPEYQSKNATHSEHVAATVAEQPAAPAKGLFDSDCNELDQETPADVPSSVEEPKSGYNASRYVMLIQQVQASQDLDEPLEESDRRWHASPHARFERLLRETQVPAGLLTNGRNLRLVYAPRGETSGYLTFNVQEMMTVAGRPIFAAFHMLLNSDRLFNLEKKQRLPNILVESRKYQNTVSTQLAQQVMAALYEFLRGFQAADDQWNGRLLKDVLAKDPQHVYHGLLTVLMRTVFVLYAEDRNLLSNHPLYTNYYSITGLFERLRSDAGQYPDTMDQRYGAWAQLLTLFRMIYEGGSHAELQIPPRKGYLFDPERYPFLEGVSGVRGQVSGESQEEVSGTGDQVSGESQDLTPETRNLKHETRLPPKPDTRNPIPRVSDGVVYRVLNNLLMLDGERLSYRSLDVEQIGSVYEAIMGFEVEVSAGRSIAIKPAKKHGAPATINLEELLKQKADDRAKWLKERTDQSMSGQALEALKSAATIDRLLAAVDRKIDNLVTPNVVPAGAMVFQPSDERRRTGSHYTPRSLTESIVRTTLRPVLEQLGPQPTPDQILAVKVCDPAMGSGAFLVEACRQLADELVKSWYVHCERQVSGAGGQGSAESKEPTAASPETRNPKPETRPPFPTIPPDEDEVLYARRIIAQRCLYGVDKNPMAVDLAKLSLWLVTLAKDHPFSFLDHTLRSGDSLVGLTREQIVSFTWKPVAAGTGLARKKKSAKRTSAPAIPQPPPPDPRSLFGDPIAERMRTVTEYRQRILAARDDVRYEHLRQQLDYADEQLSLARLTGDCVIAAYFSGGKDRERVAKLDTLARQLVQYLGPQRRIEDRQPLTAAVASLHGGDHPIQPFHWQIEFPEVFTVDANGKPTGGFDAIVGNPPFAGKNTLINGNREGYLDWLKTLHEESHGNADLVAHFFRRAFSLLRPHGCFGLIATNTIGQGDTRSTGLRWICTHGGTIYTARKRLKWPGQAAVVVSVVNVCHGSMPRPFVLDGRDVPIITAYLFHAGGHDAPATLQANGGKSFIGSYLLGMGFTFDDTDTNGVASPIEEMHRLIAKDSRNGERICPYIGGEEVNDSPTHSHHRYVINFEGFPLERVDNSRLSVASTKSWGAASESEREAWLRAGRVPLDYPHPVAADWPDLLHIVEQKVKPARLTNNRDVYRRLWWQFGEKRRELQIVLRKVERVIVNCQVSPNLGFAILPATCVFAHTLDVFAMSSSRSFAVLQSSSHEAWTRLMASSMKDDMRYTPSDCFETFPFPAGALEHAAGDSPTTDNGPLTTLETAGREYYEFRAALMVRNNEGLTKTYNRFHDPHETSPDILQLRALHAAMDRAVLEAYAWHDLAQTARCEFLLDYEEEVDSSELSVASEGLATGNHQLTTRSRKRLPWRLRWPDEFRDEVLARLLELNEQRHKEELLAGKAITTKRSTDDDDDESNPDTDEEAESPKPKKTATKSTPKPKAPRKSKKSPATGQQEMDF